MRLTNNFKLREFQCKCGCEMPAEVLVEVKKLAEELQDIRDFIGRSITINSAYRCKAHNKAQKGKFNSQHLLGKAADLNPSDLSAEGLFRTLEVLTQFGYILDGGIGIYNTFVHYDIRDTHARWNNTTRN